MLGSRFPTAGAETTDEACDAREEKDANNTSNADPEPQNKGAGTIELVDTFVTILDGLKATIVLNAVLSFLK